MDFHEVSNVFRLMSISEFERLKDSIERNGLRHPIIVYEGKIVDGRNRYNACIELGITPEFIQWDGFGDLMEFVVLENLDRRHLSETEKSVAYLEIRKWYKQGAKERQRLSEGRGKKVGKNLPTLNPDDSKAVGRAAKALGTNRQYLQDVVNIDKKAPDLIQEMKEGKKTIVAARQELRRREAKEAPPLPTENKYRVIYADPPWSYSNNMTVENERKSTSMGDPQDHYPTMATQAICDLGIEVRKLTEDNAVLFLWSTVPHLPEALRVVQAWGFKYKTLIAWDKQKKNYGHYLPTQIELLILATKGACTPDTGDRQGESNFQSIKKTKHSEKPEKFRQLIDMLYIHGNKLEMFSRKEMKGWDRWGNE
jgi:N6-adenosine-specific RNA methylase IME4